MPEIVAVHSDAERGVSKHTRERIRLVPGRGVEDDAHFGETVRHRSRMARDPSQPNLRQLHLIHSELHDELREAGFAIEPGQMGENVTTRGVDLLALPLGIRLHIGDSVVAELTGLPPQMTEGEVGVFREHWAYSSAKAERELGYRSRPLREGLAQTVAWLREQGRIPPARTA